MATVSADIFRAVMERKLLAIDYHNARGEDTRYWIGIKDIDPVKGTCKVMGMHLVRHDPRELTVRIDGITSSEVLDGTYFAVPPDLVRRLEEHPEAFESVFGSVANLKVLSYYADCVKLEAAPMVADYTLVPRIDEDSFTEGTVALDDEQFAGVVRAFGMQARKKHAGATSTLKQVAMNILSVHTKRGLYVLAYRELRLDVLRRAFIIGRNVVFCHEFMVFDGKARQRMSITRFLSEDEFSLLDDFANRREDIASLIAARLGPRELVDDTPHVFEVSRQVTSSLERDYDKIRELAQEDVLSYPLRAFFGELTRTPVRRRRHPLVTIDSRANLDQLLAMQQAMRLPLTYVQGPPGTGKTATIVNIIVSAFFNGRTVLFASYNNHPVDGVCESLQNLDYHGKPIPFPILRLGNRHCVEEALLTMSDLSERAAHIGSSKAALESLKETLAGETERLLELLERYEERRELEERRECLLRLKDSSRNLNFTVALETEQLRELDERLGGIESAEDMLEEARGLVAKDPSALAGYLYLRSARMVRRLREPRYADLADIVDAAARRARTDGSSDGGEKGAEDPVTRLNRWIREPRNLRRLLSVFPVIATTCLSAGRLGDATPTFDLTIIDEASQCDAATTLMPVARCENLVLVGDPQQLSPVVTLDAKDNETLRRTYRVTDEYDYVRNSVYKVFLSADAISNEILLREHYRCDEAIIAYNNKKYYNDRLVVRSGRNSPDAVEFQDVEEVPPYQKNTSPAEAEAVCRYVRDHPDRTVGIITPFANQSELIRGLLRKEGLGDVPCGTVHSFQGDERDTILFSLGLTARTRPGTYSWLCDNRELINVATSRAKDKLVVFSNARTLENLHATRQGTDDLFELVEYVRSKGQTTVTPRVVHSRALGVAPYSAQTETAFLETLNHALDTIFMSGARHAVRRDVPIAELVGASSATAATFGTDTFDFVVYEVQGRRRRRPVLALELSGREFLPPSEALRRDEERQRLAERHGFALVRVESTYARRYHYLKDILIGYFRKA